MHSIYKLATVIVYSAFGLNRVESVESMRIDASMQKWAKQRFLY
jgi:hypothetical protein